MKYAKWLSVSVPADTALAYILVTDSSLFEAAECCLCWIKCSLMVLVVYQLVPMHYTLVSHCV